MADVAASVAAATTPSKVDSGQFLGDVQNSGLISPSITAAMDRIFPKSPTQLLPVGFQLDSESDASSKSGSSSVASGKIASPGLLSVSMAQPPCTSSTPPLTTGTTTTATCVFTTLSTSDSGNSFPITSPTSAAMANKLLRCPPLADSPASGGKSSQSMEKSRRRYVTADREITTTRDGRAGPPGRRSSQRADSGVEKGSSDSQSRECSDSDDMCRPFAAALKEKKKIKQKKKKRELRSSQVTEITDSEDDFKNSKLRTIAPNCAPGDKDSVMGRTESVQSRLSETEDSLKSLGKSRSKVVDASILKCPSENLLIPSGNSLKDSLALTNKEHIHTNGDVGEDVSNISITSSSSKENAAVTLRQKLPKIKHSTFHVRNNRGRIRSTFLPCFVVLKRSKLEQSIVLTDKLMHRARVLPLTDRIKCLAKACARKDFKCRKRKKLEHKGEVFVYRNIFEEPTAGGNSEDEFENSRGGRSLRKRNQNISYREPTENEFLDGITAVGIYNSAEKEEKKKKKKKKKESDTDSDFVEEQKEAQKKKSQETGTTADVQVTAGNQTQTESIANKKKTEGTEQEIVIYPKAPVLDKCAGSKSAAEKKSDPKEVYRYPRNNVPDKVSVLPKSTIQNKTGMVASRPTSVLAMSGTTLGSSVLTNAILTPHTLSVSSLASGSGLSSAPTAIGPGVPKPQFFMVRIDGKDFLVPIASNVVGTNSSSRFVTPGVVSSVAGKVVSPAVMAPGGGKYIMTTSSPTIVTPPRFVGQTLVRREAIPVIPAPPTSLGLAPLPPVTVTGLMGQPQMRGLLPISSALVAAGQPISLVSSVTVPPLTSVSTSKSAAVTTPMTTTAPTSSRPVRSLLSPLAAPTSTTVLRNRVTTTRPAVHMVAPNSLSTGARCVRIMVPACSATGTPARYATVGSIASSSPLTHMSLSSNLLPQRKRAADQDLTPEKRAAKRRRLEKKYPLPPGVVIKTEPLESLPPPSSVANIRSLLPSNIQLISASSRSGTGGVQSIRIIAPALGNSLGPRPIHLGSNVVLRGASVATTSSTAAVVAVSQSTGRSGSGLVSSATTTTTTTTASTTISSITAVSSATTVITSRTLHCVPVSCLSSNATSSTANAIVSTPASSTASVSTSSTNQDNSHSSQLSHVPTSEESREGATSRISTLPVSLSTTAALASVLRSTGQASDQNGEKDDRHSVPTVTPSLDTLKESVEKLQAFIKAQVALGLKGPRLSKLEDLLKKQEEALASMEKQPVEQLSEMGDVPVPISASESAQELTATGEPCGGTAEDPFVID